jgi:hypothetical protein
MAVVSRPALAAALPVAAPGVLVAAAGVPLVLGVARALPADGFGLGLRLAAAGALVLLLPGALVVRALGWPARAATGLACSLFASLAVCLLALALAFAAGASLSLSVVGLVAVLAGALLPAAAVAPVGVDRRELLVLGTLALLGLALGAAVWWSSGTLSGEELFHVAFVRKLNDIAPLSVHSTGELRDGGVHPGYAFPLWHGALALIARVAGVDPAAVVLHLGTLLCPLALVVAYAAGTELFRSSAAGVATVLAQTTVAGFPRSGLGLFGELALPAGAALLLLVPALLACLFAWMEQQRRVALGWIAAGGLVLAAVQISAVGLLAVPLAGFAAACVLRRNGRRDAVRAAAGLGAMLVPAGLLLTWLWPYVKSANAFLPSGAANAAAVALRPEELSAHGSLFAITPHAVARGGAGVVAGLLALAAVGGAVRGRPATFVLGGSLAVMAVALTPPLFRAASDVLTLPQALLLPVFLPLPFALTALALPAARLGPPVLLLAAGFGTGLAIAYGPRSGPAWPVWLALAGCALGLAAGRLFPAVLRAGRPALAAAAVCAFVVPVAVAGLDRLRRDPPDPFALPAWVVGAVGARVPVGATVLADPETSYRLAAALPLTIVAEPAAYAAGTEQADAANHEREVAYAFTPAGSRSATARWVLAISAAGWLFLRPGQPAALAEAYGPPVYAREGYRLYRLRSP